jgi:hypothetical protein
MGATLTALCACTLADYSSGGTQTPLVGDVVTFSATGDFYVKRCAANNAVAMGRVTKIEVAPVGTSVGYIGVEFLDVERFVVCGLNTAISNLANVTRGQRMVKNGADTVAEDWVSQASGSQWLVVAKSAATGTGQAVCAILA